MVFSVGETDSVGCIDVPITSDTELEGDHDFTPVQVQHLMPSLELKLFLLSLSKTMKVRSSFGPTVLTVLLMVFMLSFSCMMTEAYNYMKVHNL